MNLTNKTEKKMKTTGCWTKIGFRAFENESDPVSFLFETPLVPFAFQREVFFVLLFLQVFAASQFLRGVLLAFSLEARDQRRLPQHACPFESQMHFEDVHFLPPCAGR